MTHVTCRLTAKNRDSSGTLRSAIEYGLHLPYICRDIMCIHDVMNIQHTHCGLVGRDPGARKVGR